MKDNFRRVDLEDVCPGTRIRVLLVLAQTADFSHSGDGITELGLLKALRSLPAVSLQAVALSSAPPRYGFVPPSSEETEGIEVLSQQPENIRARLTRKIWSTLSSLLGISDFLTPYSKARILRDYIQEQSPDVVIAYHWHAAFATKRSTVRRLIFLGDPLGENARLWHGFSAPQRNVVKAWLVGLRLELRQWLVKLVMKWALDGAETRAFSAFHAAQLSAITGTYIPYLRTPYPASAEIKVSSGSMDESVTRVLLIGQLGGTATVQGLRFFQSEVLPHLRGHVAEGAIEVRVAGGPDHLRELDAWSGMRGAGVRFLGHVHPISLELSKATMVLVPTSVPLGNRVRILSSWEHGVPVVAHEANQAGIPELCHGMNVMLARSGLQMAERILEVSAREDLRNHLVEGGYATLEKFYSIQATSMGLEGILLGMHFSSAQRHSRTAKT